MWKHRSTVLRASALCGVFILGMFIGSQRSGTTESGRGGEVLKGNTPPTIPASKTIATPPRKMPHSEDGDILRITESRITETDSKSIRAASYGRLIFQTGTFLIDAEFLKSIGVPPTKIEAVSAIYSNSVDEILQAEWDNARIAPGTDGKPPKLEVQSIQAVAKEAVKTMRKEIIAELGFVSGNLLSNSLSSANLIQSSLDAVGRNVVIESIGRTTAEGAEMMERIWESYTTDTGTLVRSTIGIDYLKQRYGDAGSRLIEMALESPPSSTPPAP